MTNILAPVVRIYICMVVVHTSYWTYVFLPCAVYAEAGLSNWVRLYVCHEDFLNVFPARNLARLSTSKHSNKRCCILVAVYLIGTKVVQFSAFPAFSLIRQQVTPTERDNGGASHH